MSAPRADERGQAIQIGAVLLFAVLIISLATFQAFVVPNQNREIEFSHNQQVQERLQEVRNAALTAGERSVAPVAIPLGVRYPSRVIAVNPGPASGSLRTAGTTNPRVQAWVNNSAASGETGDYWTGTDDRNFTTGALVYRPVYNEYTRAPSTIYGNTVLFNQLRGRERPLTDQQLIRGNRIDLVTLNGSLSVSRTGTATVDLQTVSASTRTVRVTNPPGETLTVSVPTKLNESTWDELLADEPLVTGTSMDPIPGTEFKRLTVSLADGRTYRLRASRIGVGRGVGDPGRAYMTDVAGNDTSVPEDGSERLVVEVRDRFDNPVSGVRVSARATTTGSLTAVQPTTDADGRAVFRYDAPENVDGGSAHDRVQLSYVGPPGPAFDGDAPENVSMPVTVLNSDGSTGSSGPGGAYAVDWLNPSGQSGTDSPCDAEFCTFAASESGTIDLRVDTTPTAQGARVEYAVNNSSVATVSPDTDRTDTNGESATTLTAQANGSVKVYASSGADGDVIEMNVTNVGGSAGPAGFSSVRATSILPYANREVQTLSFTPDADLPNGETVTIDLGTAQQSAPRQVEYGSASASVTQGSGGATFTTNTSNAATIEFTSNGVSAGSQVVVSVTQVQAGTPTNQNDPYSVSFARSDGGSTTGSFAVAFADGTSELSGTSASNLAKNTNGATQTVTFTPGTALQGGETVTIDLSDAQSGSGNQAQANYQSSSASASTGSATFTQQTPENATIRYTAPGGGVSAGSQVTVDISNVQVGNGQGARGTYTVGFSREDADTRSATFTVTKK